MGLGVALEGEDEEGGLWRGYYLRRRGASGFRGNN